ncbi:MAG: AMP-binding protein [Thermochromatium sp.]
MALQPWWTPDNVRALLLDLIQDAVAALRPGMPEIAGDDLDLATLGLDSLAFLDLATRVAVQFQLQETGLDLELARRPHLSAWVELVLASRSKADGRVGFLTSGSTGQPKLCLHEMALLEQEVDGLAELLEGRRRILRVVPVHHIYGFLFAFMLPARLGIQVLDGRRSLPAAVLRQAQPGDLILGHPAFFALATRGPLTLASDVMVVTSTSPCPPELWRRLSECGCARVIEIYGSSETAGVGWRESAAAPFSLFAYWQPDPEVPERLCRLDAAGQPVACELPDRIHWIDARHLQVLGRRDGAIQVGGINVFPERVRAWIEQHPEVAEAWVRPDGLDPAGRLKAFVVPSAHCRDPEQLPQRLDAWLAERLTPPERPCSITIGSHLPRSALGKPADWG